MALRASLFLFSFRSHKPQPPSSTNKIQQNLIAPHRRATPVVQNLNAKPGLVAERFPRKLLRRIASKQKESSSPLECLFRCITSYVITFPPVVILSVGTQNCISKIDETAICVPRTYSAHQAFSSFFFIPRPRRMGADASERREPHHHGRHRRWRCHHRRPTHRYC